MIRVLRAARRSAVKARAQAANQLKALLITAPEGLRAKLRGLSTAKLVRRVAGFRPGDLPDDVASATKLALRSVARRHRQLSEEIRSRPTSAVCPPDARATPKKQVLENVSSVRTLRPGGDRQRRGRRHILDYPQYGIINRPPGHLPLAALTFTTQDPVAVRDAVERLRDIHEREVKSDLDEVDAANKGVSSVETGGAGLEDGYDRAHPTVTVECPR